MQVLRRLKSAHPAWISYLLHRLSGIALLVFLPLHFWFLGNVLRDAQAADLTQISTTDWSSGLLVKWSEASLLAILAMHLMGGIRILCIEWLGRNGHQQGWLAATILVAILVMLVSVGSTMLYP